MIGFSTKKKKSSWINLHHFYSIFIFIFFTFLIMNKSSYFKKKKRDKISKKGLGTRGIGLVLLGLLSKKKISLIKIFNSFKKFKISKFFKKKKSSINFFFQFLERIQDFQIFQKKKKKKFKIFNSLKKFKISKFFKKKNQSKFSIPWKNSRLPNFSKKKIKIKNKNKKWPWD